MSAQASNMSAATVALSSSPAETTTLLHLLLWLMLSTFRIITGLLYYLLTFTGLTLPTWLYISFSTSLTFTLNATTLLLIILAFASTISWVVRYRYLNLYSRLPKEAPRQPEIDLFQDTQDGDTKPGLSNYLDEFLSAIKVFGYLERPVFHELTRTMQTRKLRAGETLFLKEEQGFCLVVDGMVQIFVKSGRKVQGSHIDGSDDDESDEGQDGNQGYALLTEVRNGGPLSSLFSILSLFTEDVQLKHGEEDVRPDSADPAGEGLSTRTTQYDVPQSVPASSPISPLMSPLEGFQQASLGRDRSSSVNNAFLSKRRLPDVTPFSLESRAPGDSGQDYRPASHPHVRKQKTKSPHPDDVLARAAQDSTIAIIPATAFRRLTRMYPKATGHIVQVILTRFQRVTLQTGHHYLGLTSEILETERRMSRFTASDLPNFLRGSALSRLKAKFNKERERVGPEEGTKGIALHNWPGPHNRHSSSALRNNVSTNGRRSSTVVTNGGLRPLTRIDRSSHGASPGDLLTDVQFVRHGGGRSPSGVNFLQERSWPGMDAMRDVHSPLAHNSFSPFVSRPDMTLHRQESLDEDSMFRVSVLDCIFKAIGLAQTKNGLPKGRSGDQSPRLVSYDSKRQVAVFNAFGSIGSYESDDETESLTSAPLTAYSAGGTLSINALEEELKNDVELVFFPKGSVLVEQGERNPGLYYVIDGFLEVGMDTPDPDSDARQSGASAEAPLGAVPRVNFPNDLKRKKQRDSKSLFLIKPGGIAGYVGTISSYRSFINVQAKTDVIVGLLPRSSLERIVERFPIVLLTMAKRLTALLPRLIQHVDFALEWVQVNAGEVIYHQGDESDAIYVVLNGRLRSIVEKERDTRVVVGEYGQGESVGELEVLTESKRPFHLHAIRDTELAKLPKSLFNTLALQHNDVTIKISKIIASRMRALMEDHLLVGGERTASVANRPINSTVNLRTVAILPVTSGVPVVEFGSRLLSALSQVENDKGVTSLNQAVVMNHLGRHAFNRMGKLKLSQYLADLEQRYGIILYLADAPVNSPWTQTCIRQADCILLIGLAEGSPDIGEYERFLLGMKTTARKELVLLHAERFCPPGVTRNWLRNRMWINGGHHHIQMDFRLNSGPVHPQTRRFGSSLKQRVQELKKYTSRKVQQRPLYSQHSPLKGDFHRLARRLRGKAIGLVLGGGGARGIAQVGIIQALDEAGVSIDMVGGTSIGAFIGALYARDADVVPLYGRAKKFAGRMGSIWRFALDLTYPSVSYTTGHEFNRGIFKTFGDSQIEDFWLEFYCNTTNISKSRCEYHNSGYAWRYVRASMSLAGLLPPICDQGSMLLDGGYVDNLSVSKMKALGADSIIAIDVGSIDIDTPQDFGDSLSGFWALINRWNPFSSHPNPPTLSEIQARLAYVSSVDALERAKAVHGCIYMRPPVDHIATLEFAKFDEIYQIGYEFGKTRLAELRKQGVLPLIEETEEKKKLRRTMAPRRASI
ncbi:MAG: phosphatidylcholine and lysophosphatidylcholine phospholipase [Watsoniomyces obsoletus]|nr:MAG: phosphatidylcholine and lysophosphatidylcholine phospholipase [Watsoniomyces obsoletus]